MSRSVSALQGSGEPAGGVPASGPVEFKYSSTGADLRLGEIFRVAMRLVRTG